MRESAQTAHPANVIVVVFDTARADAFEPYGAPPGATPAIAELARRGSAHPTTYATASWTVPSHASMLSGRLPRSAGFQHRGATKAASYVEANRRLVGAGQSLPEVMRRAGFDTFGVSGNTWISAHGGFDQGFDRFDVVTHRRQARLHRKGVRDRLAWRVDALRAKLDDGAAAVADVLDDWLAHRRRQPFFLFVNLIECHSPYLPPKPFNPLGPLERWRSAAEASRYLNVESIWRCSLGAFDVPEDALARMRALHAASASQLDAWVARLLAALDRHGLIDETQIVLTSDHGENLGDGSLLGHAFSLDNRLIRVPLVTAGPATLPTDEVLSLTRLPRFVCEAVGIDDHPFDDGLPDGVAVAQLDAPGDGDHAACVARTSAWGLGPTAATRLGTSMVCATDGRLKLFRPQGTGARAAGLPDELVVDLNVDALELSPIAPTAADEPALAKLRRGGGVAVGIDDHPFDDGLPDGVAVAQLDAPGDGDHAACVARTSAWGLGPTAATRLGTSMVCATDGRLKLFRPQGTGARAAGLPDELVVDLNVDALELSPIAPTAADEPALAKLRRALDVAAESERPKTPPPATAPAEDEALAEQLRHLGYL